MTRRSLARLLASNALISGAAVPAVLAAQTAADSGNDQEIVAGQMRDNAQQLDKVKLPMATEPAFRFQA